MSRCLLIVPIVHEIINYPQKQGREEIKEGMTKTKE
jgi:hypothetical protein